MRQFEIRAIQTYDKTEPTVCLQPQSSGGLSLPADYETHGHDYMLIAMDEGARGAHWPCPWISSVEIHGGAESPGGPKDMFTERSALILCHELGHMLGLPDFYALRLPAENNPVNGQAVPSDAYSPFGGSLMDDLGPFHPWDAEIINRELSTLPVTNHTWIDYQPRNTVLRVIRKDGSPAARAQVKVYRSNRGNYYKQSLSRTPTWEGTTDAAGQLSLGPLVLGVDPFEALRFFLVEVTAQEGPSYAWFSFIEINYAFWKEEAVTVRLQ